MTNNSAIGPRSRAVISHGPLIAAPFIDPDKVSITTPHLFNTIRHPALAVAAVPSVVGRLPTMTHPVRKTASAVVSPMPPGQAPGSAPLIFANTLNAPPGPISTIVVPVP